MEASPNGVSPPSVVGLALERNRHYLMMRIAGEEYAYGDQDEFLRALGRGWNAGLAPAPLPSELGRELLDAGRALRGADASVPPPAQH